MELTQIQKRITIGALLGGLFFALTDPQVIALIPVPWGMVISKILIGSGLIGVAYNADAKKDAPK